MRTVLQLKARLRRMPAGFLAALLMIAGVESLIARGELAFRHDWAWDWEITRYRASKPSAIRDSDVLYLGDSLVKFNVQPNVIERRTGLRGYNLAVNAGPTPATYYRFEEALRAGCRPKAIVFDMVPHILAQNPGKADMYCRPEVYDLREGLEIARLSGMPRYAVKLLARNLLPSLNFRDEIRVEIARHLADSGPSRVDGRLGIERTWASHRGAQPMPPTAWGPGFPAWLGDLRPPGYRIHHVNRLYVDRLLTLARSRGIRTYCLLPPLDPDLQARFDREGADETYLGFLREVQAAHPELVILDARHAGYPRDVHVDPIHLDERGGAILSAHLADVLTSDAVVGPRWVSLPKYDPASAALATHLGPDRAAR